MFKKPTAMKSLVAQGLGTRSPATDSVSTPDDLFLALDEEFDFKLDPCPKDWNYNKDPSGLEIAWPVGKWTYVNPPYSEIEKWFAKAVKEANFGAPSVFLVPYRGSNVYWEKWVWGHAAEVRHFINKIQFPGFSKQAPMNLCLVIFCRGYERLERPVREMVGKYRMFSHPVPNDEDYQDLLQDSREYSRDLLIYQKKKRIFSKVEAKAPEPKVKKSKVSLIDSEED